MTPLGKPLVFYLKYMAEMNRLYAEPEYEGQEPDLTGLDSAEQVREMARAVGGAAYEQAVDFLGLCGKEIEDHFTRLGIARLSSRAKRGTVLSNWSWKVRITVPGARGGWFLCGVWVTAPPEVRISLEKDACGIVVPWLWLRGGRNVEDAVWKVLGSWAHSRSGEGLLADGSVALASIPIKAQPPGSFDVDREPLVNEVAKVVARIGAEQTKEIANFVGGLTEPDEE
jgi:hypothetical protein